MKHQFDYVMQQIEAASTIPDLLSSTLIGFELVERATTLLARIAAEQDHPAYQNATAEASKAWFALAEAPALACTPSHQGTAYDVQKLVDSIAALILVVAEAALNAASKTTEPGNRVACLKAVQHAGRVYTALR